MRTGIHVGRNPYVYIYAHAAAASHAREGGQQPMQSTLHATATELTAETKSAYPTHHILYPAHTARAAFC